MNHSLFIIILKETVKNFTQGKGEQLQQSFQNPAHMNSIKFSNAALRKQHKNPSPTQSG